VIPLPCNSACYWLPDLRRAVKTPVLDIVAIAVNALMRGSSVKRVVALGGAVPYRSELYRAPVERVGGTHVKLDERDQDRVVAYIESVKSLGTADQEAKAAFVRFVGELAQRYEVDGVVLACTEFSFFWDAEFPVKVVDSSRSLAAARVDYAVHGVPLELDPARVKAFWDKRAAMISDGAVGLLQSTMLTATEADAASRLEAERTALLSVLEPLIGRDSRVLELGSGTGRWSCVVGPRVRHVDAWDYSEGLVAAARRQAAERGVHNVTFHVGSVEDIPTDQKYDLVLSVALLHYLDEPRFEAAMRVARESVTPGGYAVFRETFGVQRRFELHGFHSATLDCDYHAVYRTVPELARELGADFELVRHEMTLAPTQEKPETCQGVAVFRRKEAPIAGGSPP
jgi:SAM-dependent methyltransferase